jgi:prepilin-type N-terminal cleavage/methylation domain-containing protein
MPQVVMAGPRGSTSCRAFTLMETMVAILLIGLLVVGLLSGMNFAVRTVQLAREEFSATQIMVEKLDTIRLYSWEKLNTPGYIPATFQLAIYPSESGSTTVDTGTAPYFNGTVTIASSGLTESYASDVKQVTVTMSWQNRGLLRTRSMSTYVARYGLQNFVY